MSKLSPRQITRAAPVIIDKSAQQYGGGGRAEFRYTASFLIRDNDDEMTWHHPVSDQRMELRWDQETERYQIMSGM